MQDPSGDSVGDDVDMANNDGPVRDAGMNLAPTSTADDERDRREGDDADMVAAEGSSSSSSKGGDSVAMFVEILISKVMASGEAFGAKARHFLSQQMQRILAQPEFIKADMKQKLRELEIVFSSHCMDNSYNSDAFADEATKFLKDILPSSEHDENPRMVAIDYKIHDTPLSHRHDLLYFYDTVMGVAKKWSRHRDGGVYVAPYFCFIQSSGMGKTKLMYEFANLTKEEEHNCNISCDLVVSSNVCNNKAVFAKQLNFPGFSGCDETTSATQTAEAAKKVYELLDNTFIDVKSPLRQKQKMKKIHVIMFDEAQFLLNEKFNEPAFLFRCIRVWLRAKKLDRTVVAVFTGTSSAILNYNLHSDKNLEVNVKSASRGVYVTEGGSYYKKGLKTFAPFLCTTTMGALSTRSQNGTEYENSIGYGRPLFAIMQRNDQLEPKIGTLLHRLLLTEDLCTTDWCNQPLSWLSVLATRVQMGSTTLNVTAKLVARGYANLISVSEGETAATFSCLQDPVCARLAMCMMDKDWHFRPQYASNIFSGEGKEWWTDKIKILYSSGLCHPDKGDVGEVLVALYFLFCGDECRQQLIPKNQDYDTFSVPLHCWVASLLTAKSEAKSDSPTASTSPKETKERHKKPKIAAGTSVIDISFIQFCRNCLRQFGQSWAAFADQEFLSHLYAAGTAFYMYPGCPLIDLAAPMRITNGKTISFGALLVSIKSQNYLDPKNAAEICRKMKAKAEAGQCRSTLCLLVVFGQEATTEDEADFQWGPDKLVKLANGDNVSAVLRLPQNDRFNLTRTFIDLTSFGKPQLLESHSFIRALSKDSKMQVFEGENLEDVEMFRYEAETGGPER